MTHYQNSIKANIILIYNAIDIKDFKSKVTKKAKIVRAELGVKEGIFLVGIVGNFQEWKGHMTVVKAIGIFKKKYPNIICLFIGDVSIVA